MENKIHKRFANNIDEIYVHIITEINITTKYTLNYNAINKKNPILWNENN